MMKNQTWNLSAEVIPKNASKKNLEYISSDSSILKVSGSGAVRAVACGKASITCKATDGSNIVAICEITVIQPVTKIYTDVKVISLLKGEKTRWIANLEPRDATNRKIIYETASNSIATIDSDGSLEAMRIITVFWKHPDAVACLRTPAVIQPRPR